MPKRAVSSIPTGSATLWAASAASVFGMLGVGANVWTGASWILVHLEPSLTSFEFTHGLESARFRYNQRLAARARREGGLVQGQHAGLTDFFVPLPGPSNRNAVLVSGPFLTSRPTAADVLGRWHALTGSQGHPGDPEFAQYLAQSLDTLVLQGPELHAFGRFLEYFAELMAERTTPDSVPSQVLAARATLERARVVERTWESARSMVDERTGPMWSSRAKGQDLSAIGLRDAPDQALVALFVSRKDTDPVDDVVLRHSFQRACVELARKKRDAIAGQIGEHGVVFLQGGRGSAQYKRQRLLELGEAAQVLARRNFRLDVHLGSSSLPSSAPLHQHYQAALGAAESALSQGVRLRGSDVRPEVARLPLRLLGRRLGELRRERPTTLAARFDRYLETVAIHCGHRLEPMRALVDAGFQQISLTAAERGALDERAFQATCEDLERAAHEAGTVRELFAVYRRAVADLIEAVERPKSARRDRSLRRAIKYIHAHYTEPLMLETVARLSGFAPTYFSHLFKDREKKTFERYVQDLRVDRAKQLLRGTDLDLQHIAVLTGFRTRFYLGRMFKRAVRMTPLDYRRSFTD